tara:strand:- start:956 stop:1075 length:120 start_codon:yes stop_codon:yes gene_type:complete
MKSFGNISIGEKLAVVFCIATDNIYETDHSNVWIDNSGV